MDHVFIHELMGQVILCQAIQLDTIFIPREIVITDFSGVTSGFYVSYPAEKVGTSVRLKTVVFYKAWEYISGNAVFTQVKKQS